ERVPEGSPGSDRVERSRPVDDGVAQLDAAEIHRQCPDPGTSAVSISSPRPTGPSTQSRIYPPVACGIAQPKQAPKPQAIGASSASSHATPRSAHRIRTASSIAGGPQA